jgi:FkbM family methyltransferase
MIPKLLPRGGTFIDIGANVGVYSMLAASIVGVAGKVISIEPFPEIYAQLYRNVAANRFGDIVRTRNLCICGATGPTILWMNYDRPHSFSLNREGLSGGLSVLSVRLDDLVKWEGLEEIDYIKIDAEGAEMATLDGSEYVLARFRPIVQIEDVDRIIYQRLKRYRAFSVPGTRNSLLIPDERFAKIGNVFTMPWQQLD